MVGEAEADRGVEALEDVEPCIELSLEFLVEIGLLRNEVSKANSVCASVDMTSFTWICCHLGWTITPKAIRI